MLDINQISQQQYIPTSIEIKRVLLMYFFVGIMIQLSKSQLTMYEYQHLKQSLGWVMSCLLLLMIMAPLWFIPYGFTVIVLVLLGMIGYGSWLLYNVFRGIYSEQGLLIGIGTWILNIFDHHVEVINK